MQGRICNLRLWSQRCPLLKLLGNKCSMKAPHFGSKMAAFREAFNLSSKQGAHSRGAYSPFCEELRFKVAGFSRLFVKRHSWRQSDKLSLSFSGTSFWVHLLLLFITVSMAVFQFGLFEPWKHFFEAISQLQWLLRTRGSGTVH